MRILILAPPGVQSLDVVEPAEVFWEAARRPGDENAYRIEIVGTQAEPKDLIAVCNGRTLKLLAMRSFA
jgi:hypothetical protein